jgi:hypothetical protein
MITNMLVVENCCRHVLNAKSLGKDQTKKRKMMLKQLKDEVMVGVAEKNTEDDVPLRGRGL